MAHDHLVAPTYAVRMYGEALGDYQTVNGWWEARHPHPLPETLLPPLGVIVEVGSEPVAALWCYECFGIGVCFLEYAVANPTVHPHITRAAIDFALEACIEIAKMHGDFSYFRAVTSPTIARHLQSLGFALDERDCQQLTLRKD
ncbi:hypothetical protein UFOVP1329_13 [uncultured Caudovirales phage]|uniref:Uncharacterized protein n=1 Tax=uncultured Caudovirales phage TaxID=2100421 RepID=A0A6J5R4T4_9CAUD|nr:hypothetical protein UFOVP1150_38 [uncultured Caudovirales phage]CAB4199000.1 hypothetical protein UFOVP1329_13 [uncultured Caudovirales phage]CAB4218544.1 hypothetical protein UFOVP1595_23 [uncultured Caudovirales phage]